ncbi:MAG: hypothetical protein J1E85_00820 [Ruminococcus sp.]|nr:hypothetical protein [Ruminococcus sp.]
MKKILAILLAGMMTATALAGCGDGQSSNEPSNNETNGSGAGLAELDADGFVDAAELGDEQDASIKVWAPDAAVSITQKMCDAFAEHYADKNISISVVAQGENDAATQAQSDVDAAADVFGFASDQLDNLINSGVISECAYAENVIAMNTEESVKAGTVDGKLYYYPETTNGYFLVYDKSVVSDEQAQKFEDVLAACKAADKRFIMDAGNGYYSCIFTFTGGVTIDGYADEEQTVQNFVDYDEDTAVATLQAFAQLIKDYKGTFTSLSVDKIASGFADGSCGAGIDGVWDIESDSAKLGDNFGAAKLPTINVNGEDKAMISMYGYKALGVKSTTKYPLTSAALALYLTGESCQRQRAEEIQWGPTNTTVSEEDVVKNSAALTASVDQSKNSVAQVHITSTFWDPMANLGNQIINDDWDPTNTDKTKDLLTATVNNIKDE